jgi:S-ribosylhomocysteine lyase LuxS involved in autoinducer biosynthesis
MINGEIMKKGQIADAERYALNEFDKWNDITGAIEKNCGWYYEMQSVIEDAVHIGIQMALYGKVNYNEDNEVIKEK